MGCHTWYYRKIERTQEEAKQRCLSSLKRGRNLAWKIFRKPTSYCGINWAGEYDFTPEEFKIRQLTYINSLNRKIKIVSHDKCKRAVWNRQNDRELTIYVDDKGLFIEDTGYHDGFRIGNYPDDQLFSLEETLKFLEDNDSKISFGYSRCINPKADYKERKWEEVDREEFKIKCIERLKKFWDSYPEGMIQFG